MPILINTHETCLRHDAAPKPKNPGFEKQVEVNRFFIGILWAIPISVALWAVIFWVGWMIWEVVK